MSKYSVTWGIMGSSGKDFDDFAEALACYREHEKQPHGASITGAEVDGDYDYDRGCFVQCNDGLTDEERDAVEGEDASP